MFETPERLQSNFSGETRGLELFSNPLIKPERFQRNLSGETKRLK